MFKRNRIFKIIMDKKTQRKVSSGAEEILGREFKILDKGFIRLIDYMGNDSSIAQAARVSYGEGTKKVSEDRGLIRYLMRHRHTTPFEMIETKWHAKIPIFVARQWIRHRTASVNEYSGRYSVMKEEVYIPKDRRVQFQSSSNKQGSSVEEVPAELRQEVIKILEKDADITFGHYREMEEKGIARELARIDLQLSTYTEWYWKINLHNLFHFLKLRMDSHAQYEMRQYAIKMGEITKKSFPLAYEAFEDYQLNSVNLSSPESFLLGKMIRNKKEEIPLEWFKKMGLVTKSGKLKGEAVELNEKISRILKK